MKTILDNALTITIMLGLAFVIVRCPIRDAVPAERAGISVAACRQYAKIVNQIITDRLDRRPQPVEEGEIQDSDALSETQKKITVSLIRDVYQIPFHDLKAHYPERVNRAYRLCVARTYTDGE